MFKKLLLCLIVPLLLLLAGCASTSTSNNSTTLQPQSVLNGNIKLPTYPNRIYPVDYGIISTTLVPSNIQDLVIPYAKLYAIDPLIIYAIIRTESSFNPAVRNGQCYGLMQLNINTARDVMPDITTSQLYDPQTNIHIGVVYMKYCLLKYPNNIGYAVSAYNAGYGNVAKWIKNNPDFTISDIPYTETRNYVQSILNYYLMYSNLI